MTPEYKSIKKLVPHCPKCKKELAGNGSVVLPYACPCGKWRPLYDEDKGFNGEYWVEPYGE